MHFTSRFADTFTKKISFDLDKKLHFNKKKELILPLGNCFLDILAKEMRKLNYNVSSNILNKTGKNGLEFFFGNFYNPLNLLHTLERIKKKEKLNKSSFTFSKQFGHYICLFTKARLKTNNLNELKKKLLKLIKNFLRK